MPTFLAKRNYKDTGTLTDCAWQIAKPGFSTFFDWISQIDAAYFHGTMSMMAASKVDWTSFYPAHKLVENVKKDKAIVVDVGGGAGKDLEHFRRRFPEAAPGSLILQDTAQCIQNTRLHQTIKPMEYDFFQPQPIKGGNLQTISYTAIIYIIDERCLL